MDKVDCVVVGSGPSGSACSIALARKGIETVLVFNYEGCMECGTCRFVCPLGAIDWSYPRGGFGVAYRWG